MSPWLGVAAVSAALLGVTWVLYPWLAIRRGDRRPPAPAGDPEWRPMVSVVLATREPADAVAIRLRDLLATSWPAEHLEIVVAVDGDPASHEYASLGGGRVPIRVTGTGRPGGKAAALNVGVAAATGEVIVFADTAQRFQADAIPRLVAALGGTPFVAVSGALRLGAGGEETPVGRYWALERRLREAEARVHSTIGVTGAIWAMRRQAWAPLPAGLILDDLWTPLRLALGGQRVGFVPGAVATDSRPASAGQEYRRKVRTLSGNFQLLAWMPAVLRPWRNPVWVAFVCHKVLRLATPWAVLGLGLGLAGAGLRTWPHLAPAAGAALLAAALAVAVLPGQPGRRTRGAVRWFLAMQGALVMASWNGLRGRWNVWE